MPRAFVLDLRSSFDSKGRCCSADSSRPEIEVERKEFEVREDIYLSTRASVDQLAKCGERQMIRAAGSAC